MSKIRYELEDLRKSIRLFETNNPEVSHLSSIVEDLVDIVSYIEYQVESSLIAKTEKEKEFNSKKIKKVERIDKFWQTNWKCYRAFSLVLRCFNLNTNTIKFAWCRLKLISQWESSGHVYPENKINYPDQD